MFLVRLLIFFILLAPTTTWALDPQVAKLEASESVAFKSPPIDIVTFDNGLKLYFLQNPELPTFEMSAMIHWGKVHEPFDKRGLVSLTMAALRTGGTQTLSGDEVDKKLEQVAASLSFDVQPEYATLKVKSLIKDRKIAIQLFFNLLFSPGFEQEKFELARKRLLDSIGRRNERPSHIARREFKQILYGDKSPWARLFNQKTLSAVTRDDIVKAHQDYVTPDRIWLAVSGAIGFDDLKQQLKPFILKQTSQGKALPKLKSITKKWQPGVYLIDKESNQSSVSMGHFGEQRFNKDKYALVVADNILGASVFGSRLGNQIRTKMGLAYTAYSSFGFSTDLGTYTVNASTKSESTVKMIAAAKKVIADALTQKPLTQKEVDFAKKSILNKLIFQYEDPFNIVEARRYYDYFGYPPDYFSVYQKEIKKVTLNQVNAMIEKYLFPDQFIVVIVGDKDKLTGLETLGLVKERALDFE